MIGEVISSAKKIYSEVIIDSLSIDKTRSIALSLGANFLNNLGLVTVFKKSGWG